jgi:Family of unknown function (DUF5335)
MAAQKIDRAEWRSFFDAMSKALVGMRAEIEVASLALGDQIEAEWLPLLGITYDSKGPAPRARRPTPRLQSAFPLPCRE